MLVSAVGGAFGSPGDDWRSKLRRACRDNFTEETRALLRQHCIAIAADDSPTSRAGKVHVDDIRDSKGNTLLHYACEGGLLEAVHVLVREYGANTESSSRHGNVPIHHASRRGHVACMRVLVETYGARPNPITAGLSTPLHRAALEGRDEAIAFLLAAGSSPFLVNKTGATPAQICGSSDRLGARGSYNVERSRALLERYASAQAAPWRPASHALFPPSARTEIATLLVIARSRVSRTRFRHSEAGLHRLSFDMLAYLFAWLAPMHVLYTRPSTAPASVQLLD